jgi:hypothetical protein
VLGDPRLRADEPRQVIEAIKRAGELGAPELAESLVSLLTFAQTFPEDRIAEETGVVFHTNSMSVGRRYPAVSALFQIGKPALSALVKRIGSSANDEPLARDNAAEAMMLIFREDPQQGVCYLRAAAAKASTPTAVYYLNEAAAYGEKRWVIPVVGSASSCPNN